jgi:hypothetical protein
MDGNINEKKTILLKQKMNLSENNIFFLVILF